MLKPTLTIITASWNRKTLLENLYCSINNQVTDYETIEWIVVDDGSTDNTEHLVKRLKSQSRFTIIFIRNEINKGKCAAINLGVKISKGDWIAIIDSDDVITPGALSEVIFDAKNTKDSRVGAYFYTIRVRTPKGCNINRFRNPDKLSAFYEWANTGRLFDTASIFRAHLLKENPFPIEPGETFMAESWIFHQLDKKYTSIFRNYSFLDVEYQPEGLSHNSRLIRAGSPRNAVKVYSSQLGSKFSLIRKFRSSVNYWRYRYHEYNKYCEQTYTYIPWWTTAFKPAGWLMYIYDLVSISKKKKNEL